MSEKSKPRETDKTWHHYIVPEVLHSIKFKEVYAARAMDKKW